MTKKELGKAKLNLDDAKFVVEGLAELYEYVGIGKKYQFADVELRAKSLYYSLQEQVSNKLKNEGVLKHEVTSIK